MTIPGSAVPLLLAQAVDDAGYQVKRSTRFNDDDASYLNRTPTTDGNKKKWTLSWWMKNTKTNDFRTIFMGYKDGNNRTQLSFDGVIGGGVAGDTLTLFDITSGTQTSIFQTTRLFRDVSAWYHCVLIVDVDNGTTADKVQLWVNGERADFSTYNAPTGDLWVNTTNAHLIGQYGGSLTDTTNAHDGYLAAIHLVDGLAKAATDFAETDSTTGQWVPKEYTHTDNPNDGSSHSSGLSLTNFNSANFANAWDGDLSTGAGNPSAAAYSFTGLNISGVTKVRLYFTGTNASWANQIVGVNGAYSTTNPASGTAPGWVEVNLGGATITLTSVEITNTTPSAATNVSLGAVEVNGRILIDGSGDNSFYLAMDPANGGTIYSPKGTLDTNAGNAFDGTTSNYAGTTSGTKYLLNNASISVGSSLKVYHNFNSSNGCKFQVNGSDVTITGGGSGSFAWSTLGISAPITLTSLAIVSTTSNSIAAVEVDGDMLNDHTAIGYDSSGNKNHWHENTLFGNEHTTASENFKVVTYTGTASSKAITNVGFKPDLVWIKRVDGDISHQLYDSVRGVNEKLSSNTTDAETTTANSLTAFNSDGFTLNSYASVNSNNDPFIAWCWKAGGAASSNSDGSGTSSVSANTTAGFSVVKYTGTGSSATWGHGLGKEPEFIITKDLDGTNYWNVYHKDVGYSKFLKLNGSDAEATPGATRIGATSASTFTTGSAAGETNADNTNYIAYCWAPIEGLSKFGSIAGGSDPVVDCGFAPAFLIVKRIDSAGHWYMYDKARGANPDNQTWLEANGSGAEQTHANGLIKWLPNGFQLKGGDVDVSGDLIYAAFAGHPGGDLDLLTDTPGAPYDNSLNGGGNYATLNALDSATTLSNGNLTITGSGSAFKAARSTIGMKTGKWYFEGKHVAISSATSSGFGIWDSTKSTGDLNSGGGNYGNNYLAVYDYSGNIYYVLGGSGTIIESGSFSNGDVLGFALDLDNGTLKVHKNGTYLNSGNSIYSSWPSDRTYFFGGYEYNAGNTLEFNFGQRAFAYTLPTGYKALNTYNLTAPTITKGSTGFDIQLWTGNATDNRDIDGYSFSPDLVWIKERGSTGDHHLFDIVRGANKAIRSNEPDAEVTTTDELKQFNSDGFRLGTGGDVNASGTATIGWAWDAGSAGSNTVKTAGALNSASYDQSQTWSNAVTGTLWSGQSATTAFNGENTGIHATANNTLTFTTPGGVTLSGTVEIHMARGTGASSASGDYDVKINGTSVFNHSAMPYNTNGWVDLGSHTLSTLSWGCGSIGNDWIQLNRIKVGGKELVDSGVSVTNVPTLASTYRVNTDTGFSIISYTGDGNNGASIAHGLNAKPSFAIFKILNTAWNWNVYHQDLASHQTLYLNTNGTADAPVTSGQTWALMNSSVIKFDTSISNTNDSGDPFICFAWSEVAGYSKFGSYEGNNNSDGTFVWCGFKPAFVMVKNIDATQNWVIVDSARDPDNVTKNTLRPNSSLQGYDNNDFADFLSNGFKFRGTEAQWNNSETYIFAAFAESPFKYANAH